MKFVLDKDKLKIVGDSKINVSGSVKYYEVEIEHDESWNDLTIKVILLKNDQNIAEQIAVIDNKFYIDRDKSGIYKVGFVGYTIENNEKTYQISTNLVSIAIDKGAGEIEAHESSQALPTPTEWEIYIAQIQEMIDSIGSETNYNNLQNKPQINNVELTGNKSLHDLGIQAEGDYYTKPNTGIPKSDLSSGVQTSLDKADTALQEHQDISMKQNIEDNTLTTTNKTVPTAINEVNSIAKGANQALSYSNYSAMVTAFNALDDDVYNVGQNVMIVTLEVPDLWISGIESTSSTYTYVDDVTIISALQTNGYIQVGYYKLSMLETQKVNLTNYVQNTDYATSSTGGVIKPANSLGINSMGQVYAGVKSFAEYTNESNNMFVGKGTLENVLAEKIGTIETILETLDIGSGV